MSTGRVPPPVCDSILDHIGCTPLVKLNKIPQSEGVECDVYVKCEFFNAGGSVKDRIARRMVLEAEKSGKIKPGDTLIEPTSGNTGIGLALAGAVRGYKVIITMPEKMSDEKLNVLRGLGAEIIRTPNEAAWDAPESHIGIANKLEKELPNSIILNQYDNPNNPDAHYYGTASEILEQLGPFDMFVAGAGTGGTVAGCARKLKEELPNIEVVGIDPYGSILAQPESLNEGEFPGYQVEGIGYDFIPKVLNRDLVDVWMKSEDKPSLIMAKRLLKEEGLLCGGSSGTAVHYGLQAAKKLKKGQKCVIICPDSIRNYMTKHLKDDWMIAHGFFEGTLSDQVKHDNDKYEGKVVKDLNLPKPVSIAPSATVKEAIEKLNSLGFDNLPVVKEEKLVGVVTLGGLMAKISNGRVQGSDPVSKAQYKFGTKKKYVPITPDTKLCDLSKFFEKNSFACITEENNKIVSVCTKIDLVNYLVA